MKRSTKALVSACKLQTERDLGFAANQEKMLEMIADLQETVLRLASKMDMRKKLDIDDYFPVKSLNHLRLFLNKSDGLFHARREEFEDYLYCCVTRNLKLKRPFESSLLATVFSRDFITAHKWPGLRYNYTAKFDRVVSINRPIH